MSRPKTIEGGRLVIFEGLDGAGKTTQLNLAAEALMAEGWLVKTTRSHGGTPFGEALRDTSLDASLPRTPLADFFLSLAIHASHEPQIKEWRRQDAIILFDRGPLSLAAYQIYGDELDKSYLSEVDKDVAFFDADLILLYTAAVDVALERARRKAPASDYFESKGLAFFERVATGFEAAGKLYDASDIDAERPIDSVHLDTMALIKKSLGEAQAV